MLFTWHGTLLHFSLQSSATTKICDGKLILLGVVEQVHQGLSDDHTWLHREPSSGSSQGLI
eukprot:10592693-Prorocentrum_lima.AAC.1